VQWETLARQVVQLLDSPQTVVLLCERGDPDRKQGPSVSRCVGSADALLLQSRSTAGRGANTACCKRMQGVVVSAIVRKEIHIHVSYSELLMRNRYYILLLLRGEGGYATYRKVAGSRSDQVNYYYYFSTIKIRFLDYIHRPSVYFTNSQRFGDRLSLRLQVKNGQGRKVGGFGLYVYQN
jgi:hypothetical protein